MQGYYIKKVGEHRGAPRVWLEGSQAERAGFLPGQRYDIEVQGQTVVLQANKDGSRVVSGKVIGERNNPVIDINSKALLAIFDGMAAIRVVVKKNEIYLLPLASEIKKRERFTRLREKLENGDPLAIGSLSHGGGVLTHAIHAGLGQAGIKSRLAFANEIRGELLEHASIHNEAWAEKTQVLSTPMQELAFDDRGVASIPKVEILEMGLPCSGASRAGKSKRGLEHPEAHPHVGHLVVSALVIVSKANPAIVVLENVPEYSHSASADILRNQLRDMGYNTHERVLNGKEWGTLENRNRWCLVAVTAGIDFDFDQLQSPGAGLQLISDVLDKTVGPDDPKWRDFAYLKSKEIRDAEKGSSFGMQVLSVDGDSVPTLRKGYSKGGSTDPLLQHPNNPELLRQFTVAEHARIKGVPESLVVGLSNTVAHEVLGQGIVYPPFKGVGAHIGQALNELMAKTGATSFTVKDRANVSVIDVKAHVVTKPVALPITNLQQGFEFTSPCVSHGEFSGMVLSVSTDGVVTQKINRNGQTVQHDQTLLSKVVVVGEVVGIKYSEGLGTVDANELSTGVQR
jgi:DNA (cytosine-5)-methyltransferase 1